MEKTDPESVSLAAASEAQNNEHYHGPLYEIQNSRTLQGIAPNSSMPSETLQMMRMPAAAAAAQPDALPSSTPVFITAPAFQQRGMMQNQQQTPPPTSSLNAPHVQQNWMMMPPSQTQQQTMVQTASNVVTSPSQQQSGVMPHPATGTQFHQNINPNLETAHAASQSETSAPSNVRAMQGGGLTNPQTLQQQVVQPGIGDSVAATDMMMRPTTPQLQQKLLPYANIGIPQTSARLEPPSPQTQQMMAPQASTVIQSTGRQVPTNANLITEQMARSVPSSDLQMQQMPSPSLIAGMIPQGNPTPPVPVAQPLMSPYADMGSTNAAGRMTSPIAQTQQTMQPVPARVERGMSPTMQIQQQMPPSTHPGSAQAMIGTTTPPTPQMQQMHQQMRPPFNNVAPAQSDGRPASQVQQMMSVNNKNGGVPNAGEKLTPENVQRRAQASPYLNVENLQTSRRVAPQNTQQARSLNATSVPAQMNLPPYLDIAARNATGKSMLPQTLQAQQMMSPYLNVELPQRSLNPTPPQVQQKVMPYATVSPAAFVSGTIVPPALQARQAMVNYAQQETSGTLHTPSTAQAPQTMMPTASDGTTQQRNGLSTININPALQPQQRPGTQPQSIEKTLVVSAPTSRQTVIAPRVTWIGLQSVDDMSPPSTPRNHQLQARSILGTKLPSPEGEQEVKVSPPTPRRTLQQGANLSPASPRALSSSSGTSQDDFEYRHSQDTEHYRLMELGLLQSAPNPRESCVDIESGGCVEIQYQPECEAWEEAALLSERSPGGSLYVGSKYNTVFKELASCSGFQIEEPSETPHHISTLNYAGTGTIGSNTFLLSDQEFVCVPGVEPGRQWSSTELFECENRRCNCGAGQDGEAHVCTCGHAGNDPVSSAQEPLQRSGSWAGGREKVSVVQFENDATSSRNSIARNGDEFQGSVIMEDIPPNVRENSGLESPSVYSSLLEDVSPDLWSPSCCTTVKSYSRLESGNGRVLKSCEVLRLWSQ